MNGSQHNSEGDGRPVMTQERSSPKTQPSDCALALSSFNSAGLNHAFTACVPIFTDPFNSSTYFLRECYQLSFAFISC